MIKHIAALVAASCLAVTAGAQTELNQATEMQLDGLKGLGPALTRQILAERQKGPFTDWADAQRRVKGLGAAKAAQLSQQGLTVHNASYSPSSTRPVKK